MYVLTFASPSWQFYNVFEFSFQGYMFIDTGFIWLSLFWIFVSAWTIHLLFCIGIWWVDALFTSCFPLIYDWQTRQGLLFYFFSHLCSYNSPLVHSLLCQGMQVLPLFHPLSSAAELVGRYDLITLLWICTYPYIDTFLHAHTRKLKSSLMETNKSMTTCYYSPLLVHDFTFNTYINTFIPAMWTSFHFQHLSFKSLFCPFQNGAAEFSICAQHYFVISNL